jgi:hypothetical protein
VRRRWTRKNENSSMKKLLPSVFDSLRNPWTLHLSRNQWSINVFWKWRPVLVHLWTLISGSGTFRLQVDCSVIFRSHPFWVGWSISLVMWG